MKYSIILLFLIVSGLFSCSNDAANTVDPSVTGGNWKISLYFDNTDETADFNGYTFNFATGGTVTAMKGSLTYSGTWVETSTKLTLDFGTDPVLSELSNDWLKEEKTASSIKLKDDNPAQDDRLQFVKL